MHAADQALGAARATSGRPVPVPVPVAPDRRVGEVVEWLARLRLLHGIPFNHLVPHDEMLPPESIRFFYLDRNFTDALVDGALSVAGVSSRDRAELAASLDALRAEVDAAERRIRPVEDTATLTLFLGGSSGIEQGPAERISGFVLRSRAVSGWPGLEVTGTVGAGNDEERLRLLRMERLAPAVLLVLFDGVPDEVAITEPKSGLQFGVDLGDDRNSATMPLRFPTNGVALPPVEPEDVADLPPAARGGSVDFGGLDADEVVSDREQVDDIRVPFRPDGHGTIDVIDLVRRLAACSWKGPGGSDAPEWRLLDDDAPELTGVASDLLAIQLLQFPYRQRFGDPSSAPNGTVADVRSRFLATDHHDVVTWWDGR